MLRPNGNVVGQQWLREFDVFLFRNHFLTREIIHLFEGFFVLLVELGGAFIDYFQVFQKLLTN